MLIYGIRVKQALRIPSKVASSMKLSLKKNQALINVIHARDEND
jgi:hypothetical protein